LLPSTTNNDRWHLAVVDADCVAATMVSGKFSDNCSGRGDSGGGNKFAAGSGNDNCSDDSNSNGDGDGDSGNGDSSNTDRTESIMLSAGRAESIKLSAGGAESVIFSAQAESIILSALSLKP
jgi:hypothetical protein